MDSTEQNNELLCPCCGKAIAKDDKAFAGVLVNRLRTLSANMLILEEQVAILQKLKNPSKLEEKLLLGLTNSLANVKVELEMLEKI